MKTYFVKTGLLSLLGALLLSSSFAQPDATVKKHRSSHDRETNNTDIIVIRPKVRLNTKLNIEINGADVRVNGKPLSEFRDENVTITRRKDMELLDRKKDLERRELELRDYEMDRERAEGEEDGGLLHAPGAQSWGLSDDYGDQQRLKMKMLEDIGGNRAFLGVGMENVENGARITQISEGTPAEHAGLKVGDIITAVNETPVTSAGLLTKTIASFKPGDKVTITVKRDGKEEKIPATLGKREDLLAPDARFFSFKTPGFNKSFSWSGDEHPRLGLRAQETEDGKGVKVLDVDDESPADKAGIREGDIISEFDGKTVDNIDELGKLSREALGKPSFKIKITREGKSQELEVKIPKNLKTKDL